MSGAERLYTPELLSLTLELALYPWNDGFELTGEARSKSCGSTLAMGISLDESGLIDRLGMQVRACAVGQASAAIFARAARGQGKQAIDATLAALGLWLAGDGPMPGWAGLEAVAPARSFPARHGAMLLPWRAAAAALSTARASV